MSDFRIEEWRPDAASLDEDLLMLAEVLHSTVLAGASVSFILPFSVDQARAYWKERVAAVLAQTLRVFVARLDGRIVGTVQLNLSVPPNQQHRADVAKLLVH